MKNLPALSWLLALLVWLGVYPAFAQKEGFMLRLIIAGILSLTALILLPFNTAAFDSQLVQELIIKSGIRTQTEQIPQDVLECIQQEQRLNQDPEMKTAELEAAIESSFNPKRMKAFSDALISSSKNFGKAVGELIVGQDNHPRI